MELIDVGILKVKLGEHIRLLREEKGLSIRQFALQAGIEHPQLINIEKGRVDLKLTTIYKISNALDIELSKLFKFSLK
ncbi:helix-turn-helix transcriptional regulator [Pedobacter frigidisoli]|uniref:helix-turn-helix domain-containing protein n=1 Tax=Pedobacter frigidisoli TaxID=2530455 RepID=UPI002930F584|nr:helix-turn-helix transcriptional regulator [Pedobacter frigidisoli]